MFTVRYIVHCIDDGSFLAVRNGQRIYTAKFEEALRFDRLDLAIQNALEIDPGFNCVSVIPQYEPN